jgi:hypothetical protein
MLRAISTIGVLCALGIFIASCSSSQQEIAKIEPEIAKPKLETLPPPRVFAYEDRYFVQDASIDNPANIADPLQAIRVIQLKEGKNAVLVISSFEKVSEDGKDIPTETWMGIEQPSFAPGTYDIARAVKVSFYRFQLGQSGVRFDGKTYSGTVTVESLTGGYLIGSLDVRISGETKSFDKPNRDFSTRLSGSFRIQSLLLESTTIKTKK